MTWTRRGLLAASVTALAGCSRSAEQTTRSRLEAGNVDARVGFLGDVMLGRSVNDHWVDGDPEGVWGSTLDRLRALDGVVLNLECCISEHDRRWPDKGYYFRADPTFAVPALQAANASVASLANNHTLDFRAPALADTRTHLGNAGVAHAGAGMDRSEAFEPAVADVGPLTVATIALTDQYEPYAATENDAGTAYLQLDSAVSTTREQIDVALERADEHDPDVVVASLHWGPNWETTPSDTQRSFARWLIQRGVDVVHGHSAHVLQGIEVHQGRPIIYDAGDFVDDYIDKEGYQNKRSALFELVVSDGGLDALRLVPVEIRDDTATVADPTAAEWVRETIVERSGEFGTTVEQTDLGVSIPLTDE
jgi:poly-gamma-glutamate capsule biosynthesis protein CapA/YwtB (metallophosphatase superfamily)